MELQKRQRIETAQRFQKHLEKVRDIVQSAFASLPDQCEASSKLLIPLELNSEQEGQNDSSDGVHPLDRIMCAIVDELSQ